MLLRQRVYKWALALVLSIAGIACRDRVKISFKVAVLDGGTKMQATSSSTQAVTR
jgi:hypothetical protein